MSGKRGPWTGTVLCGEYELGPVLGSGGAGGVYEAVQLRLGRRVAIKVLHERPDRVEEALLRLEREAKIIASIEHPNLVQVIDFQRPADGPAFMVMDLLRGRSLDEVLLQEGPMEPRRIAFIVDQILSALSVAHAAGVIHRDLKPQNILLTSISGIPDIVKLLDFGVAKYTQNPTENANLTKTDHVVGTPAYMSAEHLLGERVDGRSDIYSLGVLLYRSVAGVCPFEGINYANLIVKITAHVFEPLARRCPGLDADFIQVVERSMARLPDQRFADTEQLRAALAPWSGAALGPRGLQAVETLQDAVPSPDASGVVHPPSLATVPVAGDPGAASLPVQVTTLSLSAGQSLPPEKPRRGLLIALVGLAALMMFGGLATAGFLYHRSRAAPSRSAVSSTSAAEAPAPSAPQEPEEAEPPPPAAPPAADLAAAAPRAAPDAGPESVRPTVARAPRRPARKRSRRSKARPTRPAGPRHGTLKVGIVNQRGRVVWAEVYVDGRKRGSTPLQVKDLEPGVHKVRLQRAGKRSTIRSVNIRAGRTTPLLLEVDD